MQPVWCSRTLCDRPVTFKKQFMAASDETTYAITDKENRLVTVIFIFKNPIQK